MLCERVWTLGGGWRRELGIKSDVVGVCFSRVYQVDVIGYGLYFFVGEVGLDVLESYLGGVAPGLPAVLGGELICLGDALFFLVVPEPIQVFAVDVGQGFEGGGRGFSEPGFISLDAVPSHVCEGCGLILGHVCLQPCLLHSFSQ